MKNKKTYIDTKYLSQHMCKVMGKKKKRKRKTLTNPVHTPGISVPILFCFTYLYLIPV